jgi:hypothetical protein
MKLSIPTFWTAFKDLYREIDALSQILRTKFYTIKTNQVD